ncbi:capsular polysaccharide biosynthesis protein [Peribacillus deserti]|uniref:Capsular polysaccharide biosynthesis protein n=1 Tax=Peribacillus deserti TaxID=673318 RepID=A0ABS2QDL0_9BACI|nr:Wzz/FepE/Etk N-terminal domain-containing protein [Peribacillus deserti]MBM7690769.1 capsular polysaccharide biosynthesis protein [Peribacillus deserti]
MEETISLKELFDVIRKRIGLIVSITLAAVLVSGIISYFVLTPIYQASTQLLVNQKESKPTLYNGNEVQTNLQLVNTYSEIIKSPVILDKVKEELNLPISTAILTGKVTVGNANDTQILNVSVQDIDPDQAVIIANKTAEVFQRDIKSIMNVDNVTVLSKAAVGEKAAPIKPKPLLNIAIAMVVGLMAGVGLAFLFEYLDNTIKNEQDIESLLELPVLGSIANIEETKEKSRVKDKSVRGDSIGA